MNCFIILIITLLHYANASDPIEGRYSFSLTTFHPSGVLPQINYAAKAATLGPPIIALCLGPPHHSPEILFASPQFLPSPLIQDDGTSRFVKITASIMVAHTGINADGRVVVAAAQRLAVEHAYTFQEEIPLQVFMEEMALLFQEYTMKPGCRPFGCSLLVASLPDHGGSEGTEDDAGKSGGLMYRIDPSGAVVELGSVAYLGRGNGDRILQRIDEEIVHHGTSSAFGLDEAERVLIKIVGEEMGLVDVNTDEGADRGLSPATILSSRFSRKNGCVTKRVNPE